MEPRIPFEDIFTDSIYPGENIFDPGSGTALANADDIRDHEGKVIFDLGLSEEEVIELADQGRKNRNRILKRMSRIQGND
jgi:hypothetical protein